MMSTEPAAEPLPFIMPRVMTAASDIDCLPAQWEIECERGAGFRITLHANLARMFLNNAVSHRQPQARAPALALSGSRLGREERIVNALDVFGRDSRACVRHPHTHEISIARRYRQLAAARHRIFRV